jgi:hypothetical protein
MAAVRDATARARRGTRVSSLDVGDVRLRFSDGVEIDLGVDQPNIYESDDRPRSDALIEAIHDNTGL